ncbi:MAG: hypothetical protein ACN4GW_05960 [Desulforhopalus sp.]
MCIDRAEIASLRKRAERIAECELERHKRRQRLESEDPDLNKRAILKRRLNWKNKFNIFILFTLIGSF